MISGVQKRLKSSPLYPSRPLQRPLPIHLPLRARLGGGRRARRLLRRDGRQPQDAAGGDGHPALAARLLAARAADSRPLDPVPPPAPDGPRHPEGHLEHVPQLLRVCRRRPVGLRRQRGLAEPVRRLRGVRERPDEPELRDEQIEQGLKRF